MKIFVWRSPKLNDRLSKDFAQKLVAYKMAKDIAQPFFDEPARPVKITTSTEVTGECVWYFQYATQERHVFIAVLYSGENDSYTPVPFVFDIRDGQKIPISTLSVRNTDTGECVDVFPK